MDYSSNWGRLNIFKTKYLHIGRGKMEKREMSVSGRIVLSFFAVLIFFVMLNGVLAAVPQTLTLNGRLTNNQSNPLSGTYNMVFKIYNVPSGGSQLWTSGTMSVVTDSNGVYNVILQNVNLDFSNVYYLGITVGTDAEMTPRLNLTSSPYSFRSNVADSLNSSNDYFVASLNATKNISANYYFGNGQYLTGITAGGGAMNYTNIAMTNKSNTFGGNIVMSGSNGIKIGNINMLTDSNWLVNFNDATDNSMGLQLTTNDNTQAYVVQYGASAGTNPDITMFQHYTGGAFAVGQYGGGQGNLMSGPIVTWDSNGYTNGWKTSIDPNNRVLYASDGSTANINYNSPGSVTIGSGGGSTPETDYISGMQWSPFYVSHPPVVPGSIYASYEDACGGTLTDDGNGNLLCNGSPGVGTINYASGLMTPNWGYLFFPSGPLTYNMGTGSSITVGDTSSASGYADYGSYTNPYYDTCNSYYYTVWAYKTVGSTKIYSPSGYSFYVYDNCYWDSSSYGNQLSWNTVGGADGYVVYNNYQNWYYDTGGATSIEDSNGYDASWNAWTSGAPDVSLKSFTPSALTVSGNTAVTGKLAATGEVSGNSVLTNNITSVGQRNSIQVEQSPSGDGVMNFNVATSGSFNTITFYGPAYGSAIYMSPSVASGSQFNVVVGAGSGTQTPSNGFFVGSGGNAAGGTGYTSFLREVHSGIQFMGISGYITPMGHMVLQNTTRCDYGSCTGYYDNGYTMTVVGNANVTTDLLVQRNEVVKGSLNVTNNITVGAAGNGTIYWDGAKLVIKVT